MRGLWLVCLVSIFLLAGCVDDPDPSAGSDPEGPGDNPGDPGSSDEEDEAAAVPVERTVPVHWNGTLGTRLFACEYETSGMCQGEIVTPDENSLYIEGNGETLRALDLTLTWEAPTPATGTLSFNAMVMGICSECGNDTHYEPVEGTNPLRLELDGLGEEVPEGYVVHIYAYNPALRLHHPPVFLVAGIDQPLTVSGTLTMEEPPETTE